MKKQLPLVLVGALAFVAVLLFLSSDSAPDRDSAVNETPLSSRDIDPLEGAVIQRRRGPEAAPQVVTTPIEARSNEMTAGLLEIIAVLPTGERPSELEILPDREEETWQPSREGFVLQDVAPGNYGFTLYGGDLVPVTHRGIRVDAGRRTTVRVDVTRGIRPRGRVIDARTKARLAHVKVSFGDELVIRSDAVGEFASDRIITRVALRRIVLEHPDYDVQIYRDMVITDPGAIELALGGGLGGVVGEIVNTSGRPLPERIEVRVTIEPLYETRRSFFLEGKDTFRIDNLFQSPYRVELHFPDGEFPTQYRMIETKLDELYPAVRFELVAGAVFRGRFVTPAVVKDGLRMELRGPRNEVLAESRIDEHGNFRIQGLTPGRYRPVLCVGPTTHFLRDLVVEGEGEIVLDVDVLRARFVGD